MYIDVSNRMNIPGDHCVYVASYFDPKLVLIGRVMTDGTHVTRVKANITDKLILKVIAQAKENGPRWGWSHTMFNFRYMGPNNTALLQLGNGDDAVIGGNYIQSVSPGLSLGGEFWWTYLSGKALGVGCGARYETDKMVVSAQVDTTGRLHMSNVQKISKEVSLAGDFNYNLFSKDVKATVGCDYNFGQSRVCGKIDSNGVASAFLKERSNMGLGFLLSAEMDLKTDCKFGFGLTVG